MAMAQKLLSTKSKKTGKKIVKKPAGKRRPVDTQPLDGLLGFHIRLAMVELRRSFLRHVADGSVRPGLASLLQLVAANPGASQIELSRAMHTDKASLVSLLDQAEAEHRQHEQHRGGRQDPHTSSSSRPGRVCRRYS